MPRFLLHTFFLLLGTLVVLMAAARFLLPSLAFHPTREIIATPADAGLRYALMWPGARAVPTTPAPRARGTRDGPRRRAANYGARGFGQAA